MGLEYRLRDVKENSRTDGRAAAPAAGSTCHGHRELDGPKPPKRKTAGLIALRLFYHRIASYCTTISSTKIQPPGAAAAIISGCSAPRPRFQSVAKALEEQVGP